MYVQGKVEPAIAMGRLAKQNNSLQVNAWTVVGLTEATGKVAGLVETAITVTMERSEIEALESLDFRPFCGGKRAHVVVVKRPPPRGKTKGTAPVGQAQGTVGCSTPMEQDDPSEKQT